MRSWVSFRHEEGRSAFGGESIRGRSPEAIARVRNRPRARGASALRGAHGRGEPSARPGRPLQLERLGGGSRGGRRALSHRRRVPASTSGGAVGRPAATARDRARARRGARRSCSSTNRRWVWRRPSSISCSRRSQTIRERGLGVLLVEQRAQRTVALADRTHVLANGELRLTLTPEDAADTDRMVAAYLS